MNISDVINDIKLTQGLNNIALPFKQPVEIIIQDVLKTTVREFSEFKPCERETYEMRKNLRSPNEISKKMGIYILPEVLTKTKVKYADAYFASDKFQTEEAMMNAFTIGTPFVGFGSYYPQDILNAEMTGVAINKFAGVSSQQPTSKWLGFNKIQLFDFPNECCVHFIAKCVHDPSLETIPDTCYDSFMQLATLDVQKTMYNNLKNMTNVGSAFKEIQIKIDDWAGAESARNDLLEKWRTTFHLDDLDLLQFF